MWPDFQTSNNVKAFILAAIAMVEAQGCRVISIVSDNGPNIVAAIRELQEQNKIQLNCFCHSGELLVKDASSLWPQVFGWSEQLEAFFRCAYPRACYKTEMDSINKAGAEEQKAKDPALPPFEPYTLLRQPVDTRWGSKTACLSSVQRIFCSERCFFIFNMKSSFKYPLRLL